MTQFATVTALPTGPRTLEQLHNIVTAHGICAGTPDDEKYFPNRTITPDEARDACAGCPVIAECLEKALRKGETFGIWGGTTPEQRLQLGLAVAS